MTYEVFIERRAQRALTQIASPHRDRILAAIQGLSDNPRPPGVKKRSGREAWRLRVGSFRGLYEIQEARLVVRVVAVGNRREVYRR